MWMCQSENGPNVLGREKTYACNLFYFLLLLFFYFAFHLIGTHVLWVLYMKFINLMLFINKNSVSFMQECSLVMYLLIWTKKYRQMSRVEACILLQRKYSGLGNSDCSIGQPLTIWDVSFQIISTPTPSLKFNYFESWVSFSSHAFL